MRYVICSTRYSPLSSEMELRLKSYSPPTNYTTIPSPQMQAVDIDETLIDRILLVAYQYHASGLFGYSCDNLYWLGNPATGKKTQIWILFSAESVRYTKNCFVTSSSVLWDNFLGDYLEGAANTTYSGNPHTLRDAETEWLNDLQTATSTSCTNCSCSFTNGNNEINGFMWFVSSILFENNFQRKGRNVVFNSEIEITSVNNELNVNDAELTDKIKIIDIQGKVLIEKSLTVLPIQLNYLMQGLYFVLISDLNDQILRTEKIVIVK